MKSKTQKKNKNKRNENEKSNFLQQIDDGYIGTWDCVRVYRKTKRNEYLTEIVYYCY